MNRDFLIVVMLSVLVYFANLGGTSIYILDEAKNAECAREMLDTGNFIVPIFNGKLRTDKPPLHYYFMMASYAIFGVTPFAARFFSAIAGIMLIIVVYKNVTKLLNEEVAFLSCVVLLSSIQLTIQFHLAVPDPYLILWIAISLISFFQGFHHDPKRMKWFYVAAALGFMTKGLIAIALPGMIVILYLLAIKQFNWTSIKKLNLLRGIIVFSILALPWYVAVGYATDGLWLRGFFIEHNLERYTTTMEGHRGFPLAPFAILLVALLPFSVFFIQAISVALKDKMKTPFLSFCMVVCVVFVAFFSFSKTILPSYPAPAIPFFSVLLGYFLNLFIKNDNRISHRGTIISIVSSLVVSIAIFGVAYFLISADKQLDDLTSLTRLFLILPAASLLSLLLFRKEKKKQAVFSLAGSWMTITFLFFYMIYPKIDNMNPVVESSSIVPSEYTTRPIYGYQQFNPAFVFNEGHIINVIESPEALRDLVVKHEKVLIITRTTSYEQLPTDFPLKVVYQRRDLFETSETVLLAN